MNKKMQARWRCHKFTAYYKRLKGGTLKAQTRWRGKIARRALRKLKMVSNLFFFFFLSFFFFLHFCCLCSINFVSAVALAINECTINSVHTQTSQIMPLMVAISALEEWKIDASFLIWNKRESRVKKQCSKKWKLEMISWDKLKDSRWQHWLGTML